MKKTTGKRKAAAKPKVKRLIPAVGYIRMSSGKQEESPEQQREEIIKFAKREGCEIIRWYQDDAVSGGGAKTLRRTDFVRIRASVPELSFELELTANDL